MVHLSQPPGTGRRAAEGWTGIDPLELDAPVARVQSPDEDLGQHSQHIHLPATRTLSPAEVNVMSIEPFLGSLIVTDPVLTR